MPNIEHHIEAIEASVSAHLTTLADAEATAAGERSALAAQHAAASESLAPVANAAATIRNNLTALITKRDDAMEYLRIARHQLGQQVLLVNEYNRLINGNIGSHMSERNPACFMFALDNWPACPVALQVVPRIKEKISEKEDELEECENQIKALAAAARRPVQ